MTNHSSRTHNAYAVLLPAFAEPQLDAPLRDFLRHGGKALLLGETRDEYVARRMSNERLARESPAMIQAFCAEARHLGGPIIIAVDQEPAGIQRLQGLVPGLATLDALHAMSTAEIEASAAAMAKAARALGVNLFLAPILDVVTGSTPWITNRTLGPDPAEVARIGVAFIKGVQASGVAASAKHFPGYRDMIVDPAIDLASQAGSAAELEAGLAVFRAAVDCGLQAIMTGPAIVEALDAHNSASTSAATMQMLRGRFGFKGLIVSDDLDAPSVMLKDTLAETAVKSIAAGADLLLLASGPHLPEIAAAIVGAVKSGRIPEGRLAEAAERVRGLAATLS